MVYVYKILCIVTGKFYIGVSQDPRKRFESHMNQTGRLTKLGRAVKKYGKEKFSLEIVSEHETRDSAYGQEMLLIQQYNCMIKGYNASKGGDGYEGSRGGFRGNHRKSTRSLMSERLKEIWKNPEYRRKISSSLSGRKFVEKEELRVERRHRMSKQMQKTSFEDSEILVTSELYKKVRLNGSRQGEISKLFDRPISTLEVLMKQDNPKSHYYIRGWVIRLFREGKLVNAEGLKPPT